MTMQWAHVNALATCAPFPDDEPEVGPSCYCILTGFNSTEVFKHLAPIKLKADALVKVIASKQAIPDTPGKHSDYNNTCNSFPDSIAQW